VNNMDKIVKIVTVVRNSRIVCPGYDLVDGGAVVQNAALAMRGILNAPRKILTIKNTLKLTGG
jgi:hypothetical protein